MIVQKDVQRLEKSAVKLTLTVSKDKARQEYQDTLKQISKDAALPGFRPGKVPASVLEMKFGEGIKHEVMHKIMDWSLKEAFETLEEKPLTLAPPEVIDESLVLDLDRDFTFTLKYDVFPTFHVNSWKGFEIEEPQVSITKQDEDRELDVLREQNAMVIDKTAGSVEKDNIVTVNFVELNEQGSEIENTRRQDFVFTVGTGYNWYKFDEEIIGMVKDKEKVISKDYPADFEIKELAGSHKQIKIVVTAVKEKKLPELNDDLAQDVSEEYKTISDLKKAIRDRLEKSAESKVRVQKIQDILEKISEKTTLEVPETMIQAELEQSWRSFAAQSRIKPEMLEEVMGAGGKEKMFTDWRPQSEKSLRHRLIMERLIEDEKIVCSEEELKAEIQKQADISRMSFDETKEYFEQNNMLHYLERDVKDKKLGDLLISQNKIKKGKKINYLDLMKGKE